MRSALGAGRARIARQLLAESAVLAMAGGAGLLLAWWALHVLRTVVAERLTVRGWIWPASTAGCWPSRSLRRSLSACSSGRCPRSAAPRDLNASLKEGGRTGSGGTRRQGAAAFVVVEIVLALVLLVGAGLLLRSFARLLEVDPGFDPRHTLTCGCRCPDARYDDARRLQFYQRLFDRLDAMPGVQGAGAVSFLPLTGLGSATSLQILGRPRPAVGQEPVADVRVVTHDFFRAMGVPLLQGRLFNDTDPADAHGRIIVNAAFARQHWPGEDPIGKHVSVSWSNRAGRRNDRRGRRRTPCRPRRPPPGRRRTGLTRERSTDR